MQAHKSLLCGHGKQLSYLLETIGDIVVAFLEVLYGACGEVRWPAVMDDGPAQVKAVAQLKQDVCLSPRPALTQQVLAVLGI